LALSPEDIEAGRHLFAQECRFVLGAARLDGLPPDELPEIAFAGRSNVGKSSLVNALAGRKTLARTSHTPGRTQQINFFDLGGRLMLVDLPGFGYARAPKSEVHAWSALIRDYLRGRVGLRRLCLLIDSRRGIGPRDLEVMDLLDKAAVPYQIVLTKADKTKAAALNACIAEISTALKTRAAAMPDIMTTSARTHDGIADLRAVLRTLAIASPLV
jgi:GTP-binding protein